MARTRRSSTSIQRPSLILRLIKWMVVFGLWVGIFGVGVLAWYARELPGIIENPKFKKEISITVLANDGTVIGRYGDLKGNSLSIDDIPTHTIDAVLSVEDRRFYHHFGIDPIGLARAIYVNLRSSERTQGGSTITQQLAKNLFLTQDKTYKRKIQEALLALWLEKELTKDEILMAYLNRVYMGAGTYGIEAATRVYFNKPVKNLTLFESATLAGLLKAPSRYSPLSNKKASAERAKVVLMAMVDAGVITEKEAKAAISKRPIKDDDGKADGASSRYFADWVVDTLDNLIGTPTEDLVVQTTLDPQVQESTSVVIDETVAKNTEKLKVTQGASVVLRPDGSIVAMVGGIDYKKSQYNRTTQGLRQPGSSFKPIVYLAALEKGFTPNDIVVDEPITEGKYRPQNFGNKYYGEVTLLEALTYSLNTVSVRLAKAVGIDAVISVARRMGITADLEPNLALSLGSSEVPMIEMAQAYATIASGGHAIKTYGVTKILNKDGKTLYEYKPEPAPKVFRSTDIDALVSMMTSVVQNGTGGAAASPFFVAGKTGTSQDHRDAWFDGFTNDYVGIVWFGNDDNKSMKGVTGGGLAAGTWKKIIMAAKTDPSPSKYKVLKSYDFGDEFGDLLGRIMSEDRPRMDNEAAAAQNFESRPIFRPDNPDDAVGYSRMND